MQDHYDNSSIPPVIVKQILNAGGIIEFGLVVDKSIKNIYQKHKYITSTIQESPPGNILKTRND